MGVWGRHLGMRRWSTICSLASSRTIPVGKVYRWWGMRFVIASRIRHMKPDQASRSHLRKPANLLHGSWRVTQHTGLMRQRLSQLTSFGMRSLLLARQSRPPRSRICCLSPTMQWNILSKFHQNWHSRSPRTMMNGRRIVVLKIGAAMIQNTRSTRFDVLTSPAAAITEWI